MLDIGRNCFTERVVKQWNRFHREVVESQYLKKFKKRVDGALCNMVISGYGGIWSKLGDGDLFQP